MPQTHRPYQAEFRRQIVELVQAGRTPKSLGQEFEPSAQAIWNWVRQADRADGLTTTPKGGRRLGVVA